MSEVVFGRSQEAPSPALANEPANRPRVQGVVQSAECYKIRNGFSWANIYVRHGLGQTGDGSPRGWVELAVNSDYGAFGFCWSHIGAEPWREFIAGLDFHYAGKKLFGDRFHVPLFGDELERTARKLVLDLRRSGSLDAADARELWDALDGLDPGEGCAAYLRDWDRLSGGRFYRHELWDHRWDQPNPQAVGFWREIWPHFLATLDGSRHPVASDGEVQGEARNDRNQNPALAKQSGRGE